jgi:L-2-hydroxycarboxylate dehydrogenase (NAD+)
MPIPPAEVQIRERISRYSNSISFELRHDRGGAMRNLEAAPSGAGEGGSVTIPYAELVDRCVEVLRQVGASHDEAHVQAWALVEADASGHPSHGVQRLPLIVERIRAGLAVPAAIVSAVRLGGGLIGVDGGRGLGPVVAMRTVDELTALGEETGVAVAGVSNANHVGMLSLYVEALAERNFVGIGMATSEALVHPWGGTEAMIGTNPIAIGIPSSNGPLVLDMATGEVSMGKIIDHMHRGEPLDHGWALDGDGKPTTDAARAREGSIAPFGGGKGYALGLAIEVMVGALTWSALGRQVVGTLDATEVCNKGEVFIAIDVARFAVDGYAERIDTYLADVRASRTADHSAAVRIPGDRSREKRAEALDHGVVLSLPTLSELDRLLAGN